MQCQHTRWARTKGLLMTVPEAVPPQGAMSVEAFCQWASIGRTAAYREISEGRLHVRKLGRRTLIPLAEAERWLGSLPGPSDPDAAMKRPGFRRQLGLAS